MTRNPRNSLDARRALLRQLAMTTLLAATGGAAMAQAAYPSQPLRIVVPWAAGTPPDVAARAVAAKLPELLKQPVVVENKPGATGTIGLSEVARAPADGYTIGALHFSTAAVASLYPQFKADIAKGRAAKPRADPSGVRGREVGRLRS